MRVSYYIVLMFMLVWSSKGKQSLDLAKRHFTNDTDLIIQNNLVLLDTLYEKWDQIPRVFRFYLCNAIRKEAKDTRDCHTVEVHHNELLKLASVPRFVPLEILAIEWQRVRHIVNRHVRRSNEEKHSTTFHLLKDHDWTIKTLPCSTHI